jgi:hypothetical protein
MTKLEWKAFPDGSGGFEKVKGAWHWAKHDDPLYNGGGFQPVDYDSEEAEIVEGSGYRVPRPKYYKSLLQDPCRLGEGDLGPEGECGCCDCDCC